MNPAPKWTRFGRWSDDGYYCFALLDHKQARGGEDRVIYGAIDKTQPLTTEQALRRWWASWA